MLKTLLIVLPLIVFGLAAALAAYIFYIGFSRPIIKPNHDDLRPFAPHDAAMRAGMDWYRAQKREQVEIVSRDDLRLRGEVLPGGDGKRVAILMHGFRGDGCKDFAGVLRTWHELGFTLLIPCQRAHGRSEGRAICYGLRERYDCADWAAWAQARFEPRDMYLVGVSMGAATVMYTSALELPGSVRGIVADCGYTSPRAEFEHVLTCAGSIPRRLPLAIMRVMARMALGIDINERVSDALERTQLPILMIHGADDSFVPARMSLENFSHCQSHARMELFPGAAHGMSMNADPERMRALIMDFTGSTGECTPDIATESAVFMDANGARTQQSGDARAHSAAGKRAASSRHDSKNRRNAPRELAHS